MIPCSECGHVNRLGAMYCGACGSKIIMELGVIEASVLKTAANQQQQKIWLAGRNTLGGGIFLLVSACVFAWFFVPKMPATMLPRATPLQANEIFSFDLPWLQPRLDQGPSLSLDDLSAAAADDLMSWRRRQRDFVLGGVSATRLDQLQVEIYNSRRRDGSWAGPDPVASTGLAMLALLAHPGRPEFDQAVSNGVAFLKPQVLMSGGRRNPVSQTIGIMALAEAGSLDVRELAMVRPMLARGDAPQWQALALASISPSERPSRIAAVRTSITDSVWRHYLHFFSDQPVIEALDNSLFEPGAGNTFDGIDRLAWASVSWWIGSNAADLTATLQAWALAEPPPLDPQLAALVGDHGPLCMTVLTSTVTLRTPIPWVRPSTRSE